MTPPLDSVVVCRISNPNHFLEDFVDLDARLFGSLGPLYSDHRWGVEHFLADRNEKWELSRLAHHPQEGLLGFWIASLRDPETVHSHRVAVAPEWRQRGIARALFESVLEEARSLPLARRMSLLVARENQVAKTVYEKFGFRVLEGIPLSTFVGNDPEVELSDSAAVSVRGNEYRVLTRPIEPEPDPHDTPDIEDPMQP